MSASVAVCASQPDCLSRASALAKELGLPLVGNNATMDWLLNVTPDRLELRTTTIPPMIVAVDFVGGTLGYRRRRLAPANELLARAVMGRQGPRTVLDATAGLGRDAFILASLGCRLTLLERSPLVAALLDDGLRRGRQDPHTADSCSRLTLAVVDARAWLARHPAETRPGVIYLDPMYPAARNTALSGKEMQALQALLGGDPDATALLEASLGSARVVVKRPRLAPFLGDRAPDRQLGGRSTRFDIYLPVSDPADYHP